MMLKRYYKVIINISIISIMLFLSLYVATSKNHYYDTYEDIAYNKIKEDLCDILKSNNWNEFLLDVADYLGCHEFQISICQNFYMNFSKDKINYLNMHLVSTNNKKDLYNIFYDDTNKTKRLTISKFYGDKNECDTCIKAEYICNLLSKLKIKALCQDLNNSSQFKMQINKNDFGCSFKNLHNVKIWRITDNDIVPLGDNQYLYYKNSHVIISIRDSFGKKNLLMVDELSH